MNSLRLKLFILLTLILIVSGSAFSQGSQTGSISGMIMDKEEKPLPGAMVILTGERILGSRSFMTSETGLFRFNFLAPGSGYELKVEMPGFKNVVRKNLIVSVGKTTEINFRLEVSSVEEEVEVLAESPVVDVENPKASVNYSSDFISSIPVTRDLYDIQNSIPGAISEDRTYRRTSSILGGTVRSNLYALDGVPMNDPATSYSMSNINVDVYAEIEFGIGALPAEVGQTDSVYINIVTKRGGNKFSADLITYYTGKQLNQNLISQDDLRALEVEQPESFINYNDYSLNFGGPFVKERIWFFLNGRRQEWDKINPYSPEKRLRNLGLDSSHYDLSHEEWLGFAKLTFRLSSKFKYMGMLHYNQLYEPVYSNRVDAVNTYDVTGVWNNEKTLTTTHQLNFQASQSTLFDLRGTYIHRYFPINSHPETVGNYTYYDRAEQVYWGATWYDDEYTRKKVLASLTATHFQDNFLGAVHEFKAGIEWERSEYHRDWYQSNPYYSYWRDYAANDPYYFSSKDKRGRLRIRYCPDSKGEWDVQDHTTRLSAFLQDSLKSGRIAVNVGLRFDYSYQFEPLQSRPELRYDYGPDLLNPSLGSNDLLEALIEQYHKKIGSVSPFDALTTSYKKIVEYRTFSPRVGLVYDIFGDGKTAFKLAFSRYYEPIWSSKYNSAQIFGPGSLDYYWYDANENKLMDLPPEDSYRLISIPVQDPDYNYYPDDIKPPFTNEILGGLEQELSRDLLLSIRFVWKENKNIIEDVDINNGYDPAVTDEKGLIWIPYSLVDPGWDGIFGTQDDQKLTVYGLRDDRPAKIWMGSNPPEAKRKYWAVIFGLDKRMTKSWQMKGSVIYSSFKGNASPEYEATEGETFMFNDPNTLFNSYGPLFFDRPLQVKLMLTVLLARNLSVSTYFQHMSGNPWTRTLEGIYFPPDLPVQESYVSVNAEPLGSQRRASYTNLDLRVEKSFSIRKLGNMSIYVDIFNLGGFSGLNLYENPNARLWFFEAPPRYELDRMYGKAASVFGVRSIRIGARISF